MPPTPPLDPRFRPQREVIDLSKVGKPQPVIPVVLNLQLTLPADGDKLPEQMKRLVNLLQEIAANGIIRMAQENKAAEIIRRNIESNGDNSPKGNDAQT